MVLFGCMGPCSLLQEYTAALGMVELSCEYMRPTGIHSILTTKNRAGLFFAFPKLQQVVAREDGCLFTRGCSLGCLCHAATPLSALCCRAGRRLCLLTWRCTRATAPSASTSPPRLAGRLCWTARVGAAVIISSFLQARNELAALDLFGNISCALLDEGANLLWARIGVWGDSGGS